MKYDYLIVGAGLYGAVFAHEVTKRGRSCLVIDKRKHIGGNIYTRKIEDIQVHQYGAHIFHTNNKGIWDYIQQFAEFNHYKNTPLANCKGKLYNLPFNMNTFNQLWGVQTPQEAKQKLVECTSEYQIKNPQNLEEQALSMVGKELYDLFIKGYTEKQWARKATDLPPFIIKRLPIRFTFDNNYFTDKYQGIPIGGYSSIIQKLLANVEVKLGIDYLMDRSSLNILANTIIYTGSIDEFYDYRYGVLDYRGLKFEHKVLRGVDNYQGNAVINYPDSYIPHTRTIEHKHFEFGQQDSTVITKESPAHWKKGDIPYYPINDDKNLKIYKQYVKRSNEDQNILFGGRLGEYKYFDMHHVIAAALKKSRTVLEQTI